MSMRWHYLAETGAPGPDDRGFSYGDGLFETIAIRGGVPRLLDRHIRRLRLGATRLSIDLPDEGRIRGLIDRAIAAAGPGLSRAVAKLVVTRGDGERGYAYRAATPRIMVGVGKPGQHNPGRDGIAMRWCRTRLPRNTALAGIKHLDRLEQVLARAEWQEENIEEGLMLDTAGYVVCATMSNLFLVRGGEVVTPALTHAGVAGVMRSEVLELVARLGRGSDVMELRPKDVLAADELFLTNSQFVLRPVVRLGRRRWHRGPVTAIIREGLKARGIAE